MAGSASGSGMRESALQSRVAARPLLQIFFQQIGVDREGGLRPL